MADMMPKTVLASGKPSVVYMLWAARGRKAIKVFSPRTTAPIALPAYTV
jgi:hypothetical protein